MTVVAPLWLCQGVCGGNRVRGLRLMRDASTKCKEPWKMLLNAFKIFQNAS